MKNKKPAIPNQQNFKVFQIRESLKNKNEIFNKYLYPDKNEVNTPYGMLLMPRYYIMSPLELKWKRPIR